MSWYEKIINSKDREALNDYLKDPSNITEWYKTMIYNTSWFKLFHVKWIYKNKIKPEFKNLFSKK